MRMTVSLVFIFISFCMAGQQKRLNATIPATPSDSLAISPADSSTFYAGDTISFECALSAPHKINSVQWTSDLDGTLGQGTQLKKWDLSEGNHVITATANLDGNIQATKSILLTVLAYDDVEVYCAGGNSAKGVYWQNGVLCEVSTPPPREFTQIACSGQNVYLLEAGGLWINGQKTDLPNMGYPNFSSISVDGEDLFVAGWNGTPFVDSRGCYWKNGAQTRLSDIYFCRSIYSQHGLMLIAGSDSTGEKRNLLWINGSVLDADTVNRTTYVGLYAGQPCMAGHESVLYADMSFDAGWVWRNGNITRIYADSSKGNPFGRIHPESFFSYGDDIYCVGADYSEFKFWIWKNGQASPWYDSCTATAIYIQHGHVFVAGSKWLGGGSHQLCYWRNGKRYDLPGGEKGYSIKSIYVVDRKGSSSIRSKPNQAMAPASNSMLFKSASWSKGKLRLGFTLPVSARVNIRITDIAGKKVFSRDMGLIAKGKHNRDFGNVVLASSEYVIHLDSQEKSVARKIVVAR